MGVLFAGLARKGAAALLLLSVAVPWAGAEEAASVSIGSSSIMFQLVGVGNESTLRVSCSDGFYFEEHYAETDVLSFSSPNMIGQCKYELRTHAKVDQESLQSAEAAGDELSVRQLYDMANQQVRISRGTFQVLGGVITAPQSGVDGAGEVVQ